MKNFTFSSLMAYVVCQTSTRVQSTPDKGFEDMLCNMHEKGVEREISTVRVTAVDVQGHIFVLPQKEYTGREVFCEEKTHLFFLY